MALVRLPNKKIFKRIWTVSLGFISCLIAITAYQGTLTFNGDLIQLRLFPSILVGLAVFVCTHAMISFIIFLLYAILDNIRQPKRCELEW